MDFNSCAQYWCILLCVVACSCMATASLPPARMKVAVEGVVYCSVCEHNPDPEKYFYMVPRLTPLAGAVVKLQCNNTNKGTWEEQMKTDGEARFSFKPAMVSSWGAHRCRIFLVSSPRPDCGAPSDNIPYIDNTPWKSGFALAKTNATSSLQYYTTAQTLLYYAYWPGFCS